MSNTIVNYDGSITATPHQLVYPRTIEEIQAVLRDTTAFPSPVRAKGSYHSLTPCASSDGTMLDMSHMAQVLNIDAAIACLRRKRASNLSTLPRLFGNRICSS